jgi:hypothetical protein
MTELPACSSPPPDSPRRDSTAGLTGELMMRTPRQCGNRGPRSAPLHKPPFPAIIYRMVARRHPAAASLAGRFARHTAYELRPDQPICELAWAERKAAV